MEGRLVSRNTAQINSRKAQTVILIIPRNDGLKVHVEGKLYHADMDAHQMIQMGMRFMEAASEMLRSERPEGASSPPDGLPDFAPDGTSGSAPSD